MSSSNIDGILANVAFIASIIVKPRPSVSDTTVLVESLRPLTKPKSKYLPASIITLDGECICKADLNALLATFAT